MTKLAKNRFVIYRSPSSAMWSGAATLTFDAGCNVEILDFAFDGQDRDMAALRSDYRKALKRLRGERR